MVKTKQSTKHVPKEKSQLPIKIALLVLQILLPFGLYFSLEWDHPFSTGVIAVLFVMSMFFLVWLG